jgi:predicted kinase
MNKPILYILSGLPFSGKSLLTKEVSERTNIEIVSFDALWQETAELKPDLTYEINLLNCKEKIIEILKQGNSAMYDSTNLSQVHREEFRDLAQNNNAQSQVVFLDVPVEEILARRAQSLIDKTHHVVDDVHFDDALVRIERPVDAIIIKNEKDKQDFLNSLV